MTALQNILSAYRAAAITEREKGTYFEGLICCYLRNEATYKDLYAKVWTWADWAAENGRDGRDTGIDLVAQTQGTGEFHAIQCKFYAENYRIQKGDLDSFFTASGKLPFVRRVIVVTTDNWGEHAEDALQGQQPPVNRIDLADLENSQIDWSKYQPDQPPVIKPKKTLRDHQATALAGVEFGLQSADRGKLIMACGTGKTFTSLKIAEKLAGLGGRVLFLVPSLSLLSQTLTEWTQESETPLHSFAVCSDSDVGHKRKKDDDVVQTFAHELRYPATTEPSRLALEMAKRHDGQHMSVVFSTYQSIDVISKAQHNHGLGDFDLIICDEAHRTTGSKFDTEDESNFVKVHDAEFIRSAKRLYMTATPRIYGDAAKASAEQDNVALFSMDDPVLYGKELYVITFSDAVKRGLLVDYKVIVLAVDEAHVTRRIQALLSDENNSVKVDDAAKIIGCWKALSKQDTQDDLLGDLDPMRRAVAFCQVIEIPKNANSHKVSSKNIAGMFQAVVEAYQENEADEEFIPNIAALLKCEAAHVDGSMNASQKEEKLTWLKAEIPENTCRILSNVRCLSEGVDVPALDAVVFLTPRNSQVDVVQSVGRVMRNAPGKKRGYVILPVVIPAGIEAHEALADNKTYQVVWQVLQALRSHDDRFDALVNKLDLIGRDPSKMEVIAVTDKVAPKKVKTANGAEKKKVGKGSFGIGELGTKKGPSKEDQQSLPFEIGEIERAIYAKVVKKCGNRHHWEDWANDIAGIARTHITRITVILDDPGNTKERAAFEGFAKELRDDLNDSITDAEVIEMLAQHLITKPVFDALFEGYSFASNNPMSLAMQGVLDVLQEHNLDKEADTLQGFYDSVKLRAEGIESAEGKQKIIVELYDKFFANAFPRLRDKLGIVYTPVEVVDFILHSVDELLRSTFGQSLGSDGVHILDPFTGTGTFITRLLQSGLISREDLPKKYADQIHANEIVLLAYYIAAINIESVYHDIADGDYVPFEGICLTDTFEMHQDDLVSAVMMENSGRRKKQKNLDIRVIIGNPPYSAGQGSANDNNQNVDYPQLDARITETYVNNSKATLSKGMYNSYIRAIRWASDRIGNSGVIGFVTNSGFIEANTADGLRKCLADEFSDIYIFNLRGGIRGKSIDVAKREGKNIFNILTGVAVSILVKNPAAKSKGNIYFHSISDYMDRDQKLEQIRRFSSIGGIAAVGGWKTITPDDHGDWINQRDQGFGEYIVMGNKKDDSLKLFDNYSLGVATNRDAWCYNSSKAGVTANMTKMIAFYNQEADRFASACPHASKKEREAQVNETINTDPSRISWTRSLKQELVKDRRFSFEPASLTPSLYRPFSKQWLYFNRQFNEMVLQMPRIFPVATAVNRVIIFPSPGETLPFSVFMADTVCDLHALHGGQCFPLYLYQVDTPDDDKSPEEVAQQELFNRVPAAQSAQSASKYTRRDAITDAGLAHFEAAYPGEIITKEDIFYYVYGLLHSPDYREKYGDSLTKTLPRIPRVARADDFRTFYKAGLSLAELHLNYEYAVPYPVSFTGGSLMLDALSAADFRVEKMKYGKKKEDGKNLDDKTTVVYNSKITITGIPLEAYDYVVNGKTAIDWILERQGVIIHKESGLVNDANLWATETVGNARYPLELLQRVITVSLETMKIVNSLPALDIKA